MKKVFQIIGAISLGLCIMCFAESFTDDIEKSEKAIRYTWTFLGTSTFAYIVRWIGEMD